MERPDVSMVFPEQKPFMTPGWWIYLIATAAFVGFCIGIPAGVLVERYL